MPLRNLLAACSIIGAYACRLPDKVDGYQDSRADATCVLLHLCTTSQLKQRYFDVAIGE